MTLNFVETKIKLRSNEFYLYFVRTNVILYFVETEKNRAYFQSQPEVIFFYGNSQLWSNGSARVIAETVSNVGDGQTTADGWVVFVFVSLVILGENVK